MPFTVSHAVLALPLAKLFKHQLPMAGLAIGCMAPDLAWLFSANVQSHQWSSLIFPDLLVGLFFAAVWYWIWCPIFYDYFRIRDPLQIIGIDGYCDFFLKLSIAIILGAITHLLWDGFSHDDAKNIAFKEFLSQPIVFLNIQTKVSILTQVLFSIVPLPIIFYMLYRYYKDHKDALQARSICSLFIIRCVMGAMICGVIHIEKLTENHVYEIISWFSYQILSTSVFSFFRGFLSYFLLTSGILRLLYIKELACNE
ncbi:hypothetical protein F975_00820 [Acinetobacter sp. ANC 3789]|uniref:DUF4184 family protein n=1 Tax=Acinetobacter sp. ANC 3789 TaxID=1217714 RepID=UPI0002CDE90D|nr:DUF4184 family protein [Acinetobacter sp. ANC 3789]ENU80962.1 hypothetical protein F975_00820 [Acinetobacter sp. ANC 3789]